MTVTDAKPHGLPKWLRRWGYLVLLIAPVVFMLSCTPPLWRDSDGWNQITKEPGVYTLLHWPPAYCLGARIPLWVGTELGSLVGAGAKPVENFFNEPNLTMPGIYGLIVTQHLLLILVFAAMVETLAGSAAMRFLVAALLALQAPLYTYAHTVGSESLSMILMLGFLVVAWRMICRPPGWGMWIGAGVLLCLLVLTRQVNVGFCGLLPLIYAVRAGAAWIRERKLSLPVAADARNFAASIVIALAAVLLAKGTGTMLCHIYEVEPRSRAGFTFQWRLRAIYALPPDQARQVWARVLPKLKDAPELQKQLAAETQMSPPPSPVDIYDRLVASLEAEKPTAKKKALRLKADQQLNKLASVFPFVAGEPYWDAVFRDFWRGFVVTPRDLVEGPFDSTAFFWKDRNLDSNSSVTLRKLSGFKWFEHGGGKPEANPYLRFAPVTGSVGMWIMLCVAFTLALLLTQAPLRWTALLYVFGAGTTGLVVWFATKAMTEPLARYILPLYGVVVFLCVLVAALWFSRVPGGVFRLRERAGD